MKENYQTLDIAVVKDATSRLSRIPYSKHQLTDLTVVPFKITDSYDRIMEKALDTTVEPFNQLDYFSNFNEHLLNIDKRLENNKKVQEDRKEFKLNSNLHKVHSYKNMDHRIFFKKILGEPERQYPDKEYVMYKCPFRRLQKNQNPSFRVHKTGYYCYGCQKHGNYFQFIKEYNKLSNEQVKQYLKHNM